MTQQEEARTHMLDLKALSTPPPEYDPDAIELPLLEIGPAASAWANQRAELLEAWLDYLGHGPEVVPLDPEVHEEVDLGFATRSLVSYAVEPDCRVEAYVFVPHLDGPLPSALVFHPTTNDTILQPAGLAPVEEKHYGLKLAQRGFVTISPRNYLWAYMDQPDAGEERTIRATRVDTLLQRWPEWTGMGKMVWDGLRAVDYLLTVPGVDPDRIGTVGHSLGAKEVIYSLALDERLKVGVTSEGGIGIPFSNYDAPWYLGAGIHDRPDLDHHQLVAIAAPRPLLLLGGGRVEPNREGGHPGADGIESWNYLEAARPAYELLGDPERLGFLLHDQGHWVPKFAEEIIYEWFEEFLTERFT